MLTYVIPTHDRPEELALTLASLGALDHGAIRDRLGGAEVIIVDNASRFPATAPPKLRNGLPVRAIYRATNEGAAARNAAAHAASGPAANPDHWLLMLDDDSAPLDTGFVGVLAEAPPEVAAIGAEIFLDEGREAGGLPEVFIGCGVAIRRRAFLDAGGYDASFIYYAEEYDLAARFLLAGRRVLHDRRFRVRHRKVREGRDMNAVLRNLVRNNVCVIQRYAPEDRCAAEIDSTIDRYREIARKERALDGFNQGMLDLSAVISSQPRREMPADLYDRFIGLEHARLAIAHAIEHRVIRRVALVETGKHAHFVEQAARELGLNIIHDPARADALLIATLSPGPILDALDRHADARLPVIAPWRMPSGLVGQPFSLS
jgi:GT2 family glycosyltransferase